MTTEEILPGNQQVQLKTTMIRQLERLGKADVRTWERATFHAVTGQTVDDIDFEDRNNRTGYNQWMKSFDQLWKELEDDGYVKVIGQDPAGLPLVESLPSDQPFGWS